MNLVEQMIETAARALADADNDRCCRSDWRDYVDLAEPVIAAILPQVSTVEELEALPPTSLILDEDRGQVITWHPASTPEMTRDRAALFLDHGPLTVVWQP